MKLKLSYVRPGGSATDLVAELEARTTIGQLADHLRRADPQRSGPRTGAVTLALTEPSQRLLDADERVSESELASGARVTLAPAPATFTAASPQNAVAKVVVVAGPDAGREFLLPAGSASIGRERSCEIRLTDGRVSRRHARINVGDVIEVIDEASANGVQVGDAEVQRAVIGGNELVTIGDTELEVTRLRQTIRAQGAIGFIRPARVVERHHGREFEPPTPPEKKAPNRFPTIALIMPLIMGAVLYQVTHNPASLIMVGLSPLMLLGNAFESRIVSKREFKKAVAVFHEELSQMQSDLATELVTEKLSRLLEHPSSADVVDAGLHRSDLLWARRPDSADYLELRLGLGRQAARSAVKEPQKTKAPYDLVRELRDAIDAAAWIDGVPIVGPLGTSAIGVAGPRTYALPVARSLMVQIIALHSPAEVVVAGLFSGETAADWEWLKWAPHTSSAHSTIAGRHLISTPDGAALLAQLETRVREGGGPDEPAVVLLLDGALVSHARLVALAEHGPAVGVHLLWLVADRSLLPASCKVFVELDPNGSTGAVGYVVAGDLRAPVAPDSLDAPAATSLARSLSPVDDIGAAHADDSDLPRSVSQLDTLGDPTLADRPDSVIERWQSSNSIMTGPYARPEPLKKAGSLRAVLGMSADGPHALDLRTDGPHALVGGSTNSGKSELLQSWILAMAATHSPERVTFLLVDYKGGSAFGDCNDLPHTIGLVTDLSTNMVRRALTSLAAELRYREHLLQDHAAKDLIELEKHGIAGAPPTLIIVVDEFAALVNEVPEFIDGVVNVAARGRSLGIHLILATQQPSGVIKGSLRANTNLRIALRVTDETDSNDVLGAPDAAGFDPQIPGRAMSRSGPKRLVAFQTAYAGGWTSEEVSPPQIKVDELTLGTAAAWDIPVVDSGPKDRASTDIKRLVRTIGAANQIAQIPEPRKAWLPVLPDAVDISLLPRTRRDNQLVFALGDDPETQLQPPVAFFPDREGSMAVYGTSGSGKSALLRAIAISAGFVQRGGPCHIYGLDFGSRALQMLEVLPHVGSIVPGSDGERVQRTLDWLRHTIDERRTRYAATNSSTITEYRVRAARPDEPRIVLLVDNVGAFRAAYEGTDRQRYSDLLSSIAGEGRPVGVHVVVTTSERTGISTTLSSAMQRRLVMRMATDDDYSMLGAPSDVLDAHSHPGRAIDADSEIQIGILGVERDDASQAARLQDLAAALIAAGSSVAPPIQSLGSDIELSSLGRGRSEVTFGVDAATLSPASIDAIGAFLLTGPPGSGRTTALQTLVAGVREGLPASELYYFGNRRSVLRQDPGWTEAAETPEEIAAAATRLTQVIAARPPGAGRIVIFLESAGDVVMSPADAPLQALVKACIANDHWFVAEGEVSTVRSPSGFMSIVKSSRRGLALQPDQEAGSMLFNTPFPRINRNDFPEGRGFLVMSGRAALVQVARS